MTDRRHPRIATDPAICGGRPTVAGTRMRVKEILGMLASGVSETEILQDFPNLKLDDVRACLAYAATISRAPPEPRKLSGNCPHSRLTKAGKRERDCVETVADERSRTL